MLLNTPFQRHRRWNPHRGSHSQRARGKTALLHRITTPDRPPTDPRGRRLPRTHILHPPCLTLPARLARSPTTGDYSVGPQRPRVDRFCLSRRFRDLDRTDHPCTRGARSQRDPLRLRNARWSYARRRPGPQMGPHVPRGRPPQGDSPVLLWGRDAAGVEGAGRVFHI